MKNGKYRVAFDIGGVLSKYPDQFRSMAKALQASCEWEIFVITDMPDHDSTVQVLRDNGFDFIPENCVVNADYARHGEGCKKVNIEELGIDMFFDDFVGYVAHTSAINLLVFPNMFQPYYASSWKTDGKEGDFGRKAYVAPPLGGYTYLITAQSYDRSLPAHVAAAWPHSKKFFDVNELLDLAKRRHPTLQIAHANIHRDENGQPKHGNIIATDVAGEVKWEYIWQYDPH